MKSFLIKGCYSLFCTMKRPYDFLSVKDSVYIKNNSVKLERGQQTLHVISGGSKQRLSQRAL